LFHRSIVAVLAEITWLHSLLAELRLSTSVPTIFFDNLDVGLKSANPVLHSQSKHFEIDLHYVCDFVQQKHLKLVHLLAKYQVAYLLTKPLSGASFLYFPDKLIVVHNPILNRRGECYIILLYGYLYIYITS